MKGKEIFETTVLEEGKASITAVFDAFKRGRELYQQAEDDLEKAQQQANRAYHEASKEGEKIKKEMIKQLVVATKKAYNINRLDVGQFGFEAFLGDQKTEAKIVVHIGILLNNFTPARRKTIISGTPSLGRVFVRDHMLRKEERILTMKDDVKTIMAWLKKSSAKIFKDIPIKYKKK